MIIVCPQCESRYELGEASLPQAGRAVRCTRCRAEWLAYPEPGEIHDLDAAQMTDQFGQADPLDDGDTLVAPPLLREFADIEVEPLPASPPQHGPSVEEIAARALPEFARRPKKPKRRLRILPTTRITTFVAALLSVGCLVGLREGMVKTFPSSASLYERVGLPVNLRGLAFEDVRTSLGSEGKVPVLVIEGAIRNVKEDGVTVPRLRLAIRDDKNVELYSWTVMPAHNSLGADEVLAFKSRLASPPSEGRSVAVRFLRREDMVAASR